MSASLTVMTQNVRMDTHAPDDDPDNWEVRAPVLEKAINSVRPDILATQEPYFHQLGTISQGLGGGYRMVGYGREGGSRNEYAALWIRRARFSILGWDQFWLSETPEVIGSMSWDTACTRICTWALLREKASGQRFIAATAHTDHASLEARLRGGELIGQRLKQAAGRWPIVLMGDFNAPAASSEEFTATTSLLGLRDAWTEADRQTTPAWGTFGNYGEPVEGGDRIDWILVSPGVEVHTAAIPTVTHEGHWGSDHLPVTARITVG